jgi:hypothetical protein
MMNQKPPNRSEWLTAPVILTVIAMVLTGLGIWNNFSSATDKRLQRLEDRVEILWGDWLVGRGVKP